MFSKQKLEVTFHMKSGNQIKVRAQEASVNREPDGKINSYKLVGMDALMLVLDLAQVEAIVVRKV